MFNIMVKLLDAKVTEYNKTIDTELASLNSEKEAALVEINISIGKVQARLNSNNVTKKNEFKDILIRADKAHSKKNDTYTLINLLVTTVTDIFIRIRADLTSSEPDQYDRTIISEIPRIIDYVNECFADLAYTYTCISKRAYDYELNEKKIIMKSPKIAD